MKKILTLLTGFVFLITILIAASCQSASAEDDPNGTKEPLKKVTIYLKIHEEDGKKRLEMYDSNNPKNIVIDDLTTEVDPGTKVVWRRAEDSGIRSIRKVGPVEDNGEIFPEDAKTILLNKRMRTRVPDNIADKDKGQKYIIEFKDKRDGEVTPIDPYLRIRDR